MKEKIFQKLTSRKLWIAVVGIVVGLATAFGIPENEYAQIAGVIGSIASGIAYIFGEASIDKSNKIDTTETAEEDFDINYDGEDF